MTRFATLAAQIYTGAMAAAHEDAAQWWDDWVWVWGAMFDVIEQRRWRGQLREQLDADLLDRGVGGGFAAGSGGDES